MAGMFPLQGKHICKGRRFWYNDITIEVYVFGLHWESHSVALFLFSKLVGLYNNPAPVPRLGLFLCKKEQKKNFRLKRLRGDTIESSSAAAPVSGTEPRCGGCSADRHRKHSDKAPSGRHPIFLLSSCIIS